MNKQLTIQTQRLCLRPIRLQDVDDLFAYHSNPQVVTYLYWNARTYKETQTIVKERQEQIKLDNDGDALVLAVEHRNLETVIGEMFLFLRSKQNRQAELGFVFNPDYQGQGFAKEASQAMLALGFEQFGIHRIYARCDARNQASFTLMERLGMRKEAHLVENEIFKGEWSDELIYAILAKEWYQRNV